MLFKSPVIKFYDQVLFFVKLEEKTRPGSYSRVHDLISNFTHLNGSYRYRGFKINPV